VTRFQQFGNTAGNSPFCGKQITITCNGKTTQATIQDQVNFLCHPIYQILVLSLPLQCPGCPPGGLDMTEGLFEFFASTSVGVLTGDWSVGGGAAPPPETPTTSSTPPPQPTTHYVPPTTSSTYSPPPSSSSSSSTSTSTTSKTSSSVSSAAPTTSHEPSSTPSPTQTSSGANYNNGPASSLAQPTGSISPGQNQTINSMYAGIIDLGSLVLALNP
jgi:hypothetical protein